MVQEKKLYKVIRQVFVQFGFKILTESRFVNILLDYGAFIDEPASKAIIQAIIATGYGERILDLGKKKKSILSSLLNSNTQIEKPEGTEWLNKISSYSVEISKSNGFQKPLVDYVVECLIYGLNWSDTIPEYPTTKAPLPISGLRPKSVNGTTTSGKNTNKKNSITYHTITDTQFLIMSVFPKNAIVMIDGQQQYVSDGIMAVELTTGQHSYEVKAESYTTKTGMVDISGDKKTEISVSLDLEAKTGKLTINAEDSSVEIYINGNSYGWGTWEGLVEEGDYTIEGRKHRYYTHEQTVNVDGKNQKTVKIPALTPICGSLKINVQPYGSEIIVNDKNQGVSPMLIHNIIVGERRVTVKTKEGKEYTTIAEVKENQVTDINHIIPSLFLEDYSKVRLGDYFYEDGTFSHRIANGKKMVGVVFNLNTSKEEKNAGWNHGQIVALEDAKEDGMDCSSWGIPTKELLQYAIRSPYDSYIKRNCEDNGYLISHLDGVLNNPEFKPFMLAARYDAKLPNGKTSGWYLPCVSQWLTLYFRLHDEWQKYWPFLKITGKNGLQTYATSSIFDSQHAWKFAMGYDEDHIYDAPVKRSIKSKWSMVRAVAAF